MKYYKLTDKNDESYNHTKWGENVTHKAQGDGNSLCSPDVIHVYDHPLKAGMFDPIHAGFSSYQLWEVKVRGIVKNDTLKVGVKQCTTICRIDTPVITTEQRVKFAIYSALAVYKEKPFVEWAHNWLSGKNRDGSAAWAAESAAESAAAWAAKSAAAWAAESAAAWAANSAAAWAAESAARAAARAAESAASAAKSAAARAAAPAAWAAESAAWAAESAAESAAARAAEWAAKSAAARAAKQINFVSLIRKAMA